MKEFWNQRYSEEGYKYGKSPNSFLKEELPKLEPGKILFIGEGEGRNAVFAAVLGWQVDAMDFSEEAKRKAEKLAEEFGVKINYRTEDFSTYVPQENFYDAAGIFFIHQDEEIKTKLFQRVINSVKSSGKIIFECFEKEQINYSSGGPKDTSFMYTLDDVKKLFGSISFDKLSKEKIMLNEGKGHEGEAIVVRFVGTK
ncbi:MAG: methyltransferase domain-containing protein [Ignavibacteriales bacterium]|nr:methyltransferase domain-containing protein [Ignavibacteriales bacterium]